MKTQKPKTGEFAGVLAEPVYLDVLESYPSGLTRARKKLEMLAKHYGRPVDAAGQIDWREVCFVMGAELGVPGFQVVSFADMPPAKLPRGAPKKNLNPWRLLQAVGAIQKSARLKEVSAACLRLSKREGSPWYKRTLESLKAQHSADLRQFKKTYGYAFDSLEHHKALIAHYEAMLKRPEPLLVE